MSNKIKLFIYTIIGVSLPFLVRTTIFSYSIKNLSSPYTTIYLHSLDIVLLLGFVYLVWKTKGFPLNGQKFVDKLWISLVFLIFIQVFGTKYPLISWVWGIRFYLGMSLIWYISRFKYLAKDLKYIINGFLIGMLAQSIVVIVQFGLQKNIGLPLVIEPSLSVQLSGVAKVSIFDNTFVRSYGTFPHPNIVGFAGIMSLILLYVQKLGKRLATIIYLTTIIIAGLIDHYIITSIQAFVITVFTGLQLMYGDSVSLIKHLSKLLILLLHILVLLSFSKTALTMLLLIDFIYLTTLTRKTMFHVEQFQNRLRAIPRIVINGVTLAGGVFLLVLPYHHILDTISKRSFYAQDAFKMIDSNIWFGVGLGQYVVNLSDNREIWQYEPVHNIFLLLFCELGLINLILLMVIIGLECYAYIYEYKKQG
jgi:hypothetical protein